MSAAEPFQPQKTSPNWEAIERDFRIGVRAVTAIAQEHGITEGAIRKRAKRDGWTRDASKSNVPKAQGPKTRKVVDWEALELQYRAGIRSLKDIGREFNVSDAAIVKRAKRDGWERDLKAKIQAKADAKVSASLVSAEVRAQTKVAERIVVEANAEAVANVRLAHRVDIQRGRRLVLKLLAELEQQTDQVPELQELGEMMRKDDDKGQDRLNDIYRAVISLPERTKTMKALAEALRILVSLEREAFGIGVTLDAGAEGDKDFLERLLHARARAANR